MFPSLFHSKGSEVVLDEPEEPYAQALAQERSFAYSQDSEAPKRS